MRTDAELLRAAQKDPAAFRELYDRYGERMHAFHLRRTGDQEAALDLTAETFAQAWLHRKRFRDRAGGLAGPWLFGIARNLLAQSVRKRRVELAACIRLGVLEQHTTIEPGESWLEGLDEAWAELPESERAAIQLRVIDGLPYEAVAAGLETSKGAARVRVARGLGRLRERFIRDEREAM